MKAARVSGETAAGGGAGLLAYAVAAQTAGPMAWALTLLFVGGLFAYLAVRREMGYDDFPPAEPKTAPEPVPTPEAKPEAKNDARPAGEV